jgi:hypothetical protein
LIDRVDDLATNIGFFALGLDSLSKLRLIDIFKHKVRLIEKPFFEVFDEGFSQIIFCFLHHCSAFKGLKLTASRNLLLALAVQNIFLLDVEDLAKELSVVPIVGSREEVGLLAVVNSHEAVSPVLRFIRIRPTLIFLDNERTLLKHDVDLVNDVHTRIFFVVLEVVDSDNINIVAGYVEIEVLLRLDLDELVWDDYANPLALIKQELA